MPGDAPDLDGRTTRGMRTVGHDQLDPTLRIANWFDAPRGMRWGPRWEHDPELCLVHAGRFRYRVVGQSWIEVPEGSVLFIPPAVEHELEPDHRAGRCGLACWHGELVADGSTWADDSYRPALTPATVTAVGNAPFVLAAFRRLAAAWQGYGPSRELLCHDLVRLIWLHLFDAWSAGAQLEPSARLAEMQAWVRAHLDRPLDRSHIARAFSLSPNHVNALFRQGLDTTPGDFIRRERVLRAWHDLHVNGVSVAEAAERWGYADPFHFSRVFRKVMGFPPSRARGR